MTPDFYDGVLAGGLIGAGFGMAAGVIGMAIAAAARRGDDLADLPPRDWPECEQANHSPVADSGSANASHAAVARPEPAGQCAGLKP